MKIRKATNTYLYSIDDTKLKSYTIIKDEVIDFHQILLGSSSQISSKLLHGKLSNYWSKENFSSQARYSDEVKNTLKFA